MRSHSGKDKARNNMHDPTIRERQSEHKMASMTGHSGGLGSNARKSGHKARGSNH